MKRKGGGGKHTKVLDDQLAGLDDTLLIADQSLAVLEDLAVGGVEETDAVEVGEARGAGDNLFGVLDGGVAGELDRGGELLDGFFGHPVGELEGEFGRHGWWCADCYNMGSNSNEKEQTKRRKRRQRKKWRQKAGSTLFFLLRSHHACRGPQSGSRDHHVRRSNSTGMTVLSGWCSTGGPTWGMLVLVRRAGPDLHFDMVAIPLQYRIASFGPGIY